MILTILLLLFQQNPWVTSPVDAPGLEHVVYYSETLQEDTSFHILLPPGYEESDNEYFPVLYFLHGGGGGLQGLPILGNYFQANMSNGSIPEMIVVFPWGLPLGMWVNSFSGHQPVESVFINDAITYVDANYRTIPHRSGRIIEGFSMGGYGAARLGLKYPELFAGFSMLGAGPVQLDFLNYPHVRTPLERRLEIFEEVYGNSSEYFEEVSPWRLAEQAVGNLPDNFMIRSVVGDADILRFMNRDLRDHWNGLGLDFTYLEVPDVNHEVMGVYIYLTQNGKQSFYSDAFSSATTIRDETPDRPEGFVLQQNYPNPFNPSTSIQFTLPQNEFVSLKVYDITGRKVAILTNKLLPAGTHAFSFDAGNLASGLYIYRLQTPSGALSRKMMLQK